MINIVIAENQVVVRKGIRSLLEREEDFNVTGESANGLDSIDLINSGTAADILICDINAVDANVVPLVRKIKEASLSIKVIILSSLDDNDQIIAAMKAGAAGYLLKNVSSDEFFFAIRHVFNDNQYLCSDLANRFLNLHTQLPKFSKGKKDMGLSAKEKEVLNMLAEGLTNTEIAAKIFTSKRTVEGIRQHMLNKLACKNTLSLVVLACKNGIIH